MPPSPPLHAGPYVAAGFTAVATQLEVLLAIIVTAIIVWKCKGRAKRCRFITQGYVPNSQINPTQGHQPSVHYPTGIHEYESVQSEYEQPISHNVGSIQNLEVDIPLEEYYETPQVSTPSTETAAYYI